MHLTDQARQALLLDKQSPSLVIPLPSGDLWSTSSPWLWNLIRDASLDVTVFRFIRYRFGCFRDALSQSVLADLDVRLGSHALSPAVRHNGCALRLDWTKRNDLHTVSSV